MWTVSTLDRTQQRQLWLKGPEADGQNPSQSCERSLVFSSQVNTVMLVLEQEGSSSSPATVSKVPGTSHSSSLASSSSKSITELGGSQGGALFDGRFDGLSSQTTRTSSCTKTTKTILVYTPTGPMERQEEVVEGGPECQLTDVDLASLFPTLTLTSSSSSSSSSIHTGGAKQSQLEVSKSGLGDPFDLGAFMMANAEDDVPDLQARSVKTGYVGKGSGPAGLD